MSYLPYYQNVEHDKMVLVWARCRYRNLHYRRMQTLFSSAGHTRKKRLQLFIHRHWKGYRPKDCANSAVDRQDRALYLWMITFPKPSFTIRVCLLCSISVTRICQDATLLKRTVYAWWREPSELLAPTWRILAVFKNERDKSRKLYIQRSTDGNDAPFRLVWWMRFCKLPCGRAARMVFLIPVDGCVLSVS